MSDINRFNSFASDNVSCACPEVMDAVVAANAGIASSYGQDAHTIKLEATLTAFFETPVKVFPAVTGTAANALALAALTPCYGKVFCHAMSHINTDECAAPEFFTGGAKLISIASDDGKITPEALTLVFRGKGNVHAAQPSTLSITQSCEVGTVYQLDEIAALTKTARELGLHVHMDGARFANALVALNTTPAEMTWKAGIDVLTLGGTKNGCLAAEAVVFFNPDLAESFSFLHKRSGQLLSKMRFVSAQLEAYVTGDVWRRNAQHANAMATRLSQGLSDIPGIVLEFPTQSNEVFANIPRKVIERLAAKGIQVTEGELDETAPPRFVTAWDSRVEDVDNLISAVRLCSVDSQ